MFKQLAIIGTTASGKSSLAIELAEHFGGIILSLDSLALYKGIDIASAKPSTTELNKVKHYGINEIYVDEPFSVGDFFKIYKKAKNSAIDLNVPLIITGGSGFYLKSMLSGLTPNVDKCEVPSKDEIYELASKIDPKFLIKVSKNDSYRLEKWYQIYAHTAQIPSQWLKENTLAPLIKELDIFEILWGTQEIRDRIKIRTKNMLDSGLLDEAKGLFERYGFEYKPLKSIGLKECAEFFSDNIKSKDELLNLISTHTSQLAKRQRTFNRSQFHKKIVGSLNDVKKEVWEMLKK